MLKHLLYKNICQELRWNILVFYKDSDQKQCEEVISVGEKRQYLQYEDKSHIKQEIMILVIL